MSQKRIFFCAKQKFCNFNKFSESLVKKRILCGVFCCLGVVQMASWAQTTPPTRKPARQGYQPRTPTQTAPPAEQEPQKTETPNKPSPQAPKPTQAPRRAIQPSNTTPAVSLEDENDYRTSSAFGVMTSTNSSLFGGLAYRKSFRINNNKSRASYHYVALELGNVNHPREFSAPTNTGGSVTLYKQNFLLALRPQYGREFTLFKRSSEGSVQMNGIIAGGPTLGLMKPYFVQVQRNRASALEERPYTIELEREPNTRIVGAGSFFSGIGDIKIQPGINLKAAVNLELDAFRKSSVGLEIGFLAEYYPTAPLILAQGDNPKFWTSGYLTLYFGSKH
jgi:hypothetical protein